MFTIEHEFDASVITVIDEGRLPHQGDVTITSFAECVVIEQTDHATEKSAKITLSIAQLRDIEAALDLPEGSYRLHLKPAED